MYLSRLTIVLVERHKHLPEHNLPIKGYSSRWDVRGAGGSYNQKLVRCLKQSKISLDQTVYRIDLIQQSHYAYNSLQECAYVVLILIKMVPHLKKLIFSFYNYEKIILKHLFLLPYLLHLGPLTFFSALNSPMVWFSENLLHLSALVAWFVHLHGMFPEVTVELWKG